MEEAGRYYVGERKLNKELLGKCLKPTWYQI